MIAGFIADRFGQTQVFPGRRARDVAGPREGLCRRAA